MNVDDLILVSIDDHVVEPADMFVGHVPAHLADRAPQLTTNADGKDVWMFQGVTQGTVGLNAVISWPKEDWGLDPTSMAEMRPGAYDIHERVRDMNRNGILASMCFPSFAGFNAGFFYNAPDRDLARVMLQAYNDWHIDEWCAAYPGRFIPLALMPVWDREGMAEEVRRVAAKGCRAVTMPELPHLMGLPSYHDLEYWGPFFDAVCAEGTVMNLHIGQGFGAIQSAPGVPIDNMIILATQVSTIAAQDLLWGGAFFRYPDLKVAWSEAGIGWIAFYLDRCYPHSDSIWPDAPEQIHGEMAAAGCSDEDMHKITWQNTCRFFDVDPFTVIPREQATVGALRALSPDVDTETRSRHEWRERYAAAHG